MKRKAKQKVGDKRKADDDDEALDSETLAEIYNAGAGGLSDGLETIAARLDDLRDQLALLTRAVERLEPAESRDFREFKQRLAHGERP